MKPKQIIRIAVDIAMTVLLLLLMAFMLTGQEAMSGWARRNWYCSSHTIFSMLDG